MNDLVHVSFCFVAKLSAETYSGASNVGRMAGKTFSWQFMKALISHRATS